MLGNLRLIFLVFVATSVDGIDRDIRASGNKGMHMNTKLPKVMEDFDASSLVGNYYGPGNLLFIVPNETRITESYMKITGTSQPYFFYKAHCFRRKPSSNPLDWATEDGALVAKYQDMDGLIWLGIAEREHDENRTDVLTGTWEGFHDGEDSIQIVPLNPGSGRIANVRLTRTDLDLGDDGCPPGQ